MLVCPHTELISPVKIRLSDHLVNDGKWHITHQSFSFWDILQNILFGIRSRPFFILLTIFIICSVIAISESTLQSEKEFMKNVQKSAGNSYFDYTVWILTESGNVFVMLPFSIILLIIRKTRRIGMTLLILLVISTILTGYMKCGIDRDRPFLDWLGTELPFQVEPDSFSLFCDGKSWTAGFPSDMLHVRQSLPL